MPYAGYNDHYGTGIPWGGLMGIVLFVAFVLLILSAMPPSQRKLLEEGKITEEQYCQEYADWSRIPARCYKYFGVPVDTLSK